MGVAVWASVADAPWEADPEEIIVRESAPAPAIPIEVPNTDVDEVPNTDAKCEAAIRDRESARRRQGQREGSMSRSIQRQFDRAQDNVDRYC